MISSNVTDALRMERRRMVAAGKKPDTFMDTVGKYYDVWTRSNISGLTSDAANTIKQAYADESQRLLFDVAGSSSASNLAANVNELVDTWDDRASTLTTDLMESI